MDTVLRSAAVYIFLLVIFRISGKRSLSRKNEIFGYLAHFRI